MNASTSATASRYLAHSREPAGSSGRGIAAAGTAGWMWKVTSPQGTWRKLPGGKASGACARPASAPSASVWTGVSRCGRIGAVRFSTKPPASGSRKTWRRGSFGAPVSGSQAGFTGASHPRALPMANARSSSARRSRLARGTPRKRASTNNAGAVRRSGATPTGAVGVLSKLEPPVSSASANGGGRDGASGPPVGLLRVSAGCMGVLLDRRTRRARRSSGGTFRAPRCRGRSRS